jgi:hypothetical protein
MGKRRNVHPRPHPELRTPRAAAAAGIVFALLLGTSLVLLWQALPGSGEDPSGTLAQTARTAQFALRLIPFAGIAFLWFVGVSRDRLGLLEDRFFATILLGSGLLYLAMTFAATSIAGGMLALYGDAPEAVLEDSVYAFSRSITRTIVSSYAMRMAGVFMMTQATIWARTGTMPRWLFIATYLLAITLLLTVSQSILAVLIFPAWVLGVSVYILIAGPSSVPVSSGADQPT